MAQPKLQPTNIPDFSSEFGGMPKVRHVDLSPPNGAALERSKAPRLSGVLFDDDARGHCVFRAWGCRRVTALQAAPAGLPVYGRVNPRCLSSVPKLPKTAFGVDPTVRAPRRACGNYVSGPTHHQAYHYYRKYGNAGHGAVSAAFHNFPCGTVPHPEFLYSEEACATRSTKIQDPRPRSYATVGINTTLTACKKN